MPLRTERDDRVLVLVLDDPDRRNALDAALVGAIGDALDAAESDDTVGAVVVTGTAPAFCAGADLSALASMSDGGSEDPRTVRGIYDGFLRVLRCPLPTVAAVNGPAVGAGFNLALACDVRIAGESARFDARFLRLGLHPGGGHTWLLDRAVGPQAAAAIDLFGERVDGEQAARIGLAWRCVPDEELWNHAVALAQRAASVPRDLAVRTKATLREVPWHPSFAAAVDHELEQQVWSFRQPFAADLAQRSRP